MFICINATFDFIKEIFFVNNAQVITFSLCKLKKILFVYSVQIVTFSLCKLKINNTLFVYFTSNIKKYIKFIKYYLALKYIDKSKCI